MRKGVLEQGSCSGGKGERAAASTVAVLKATCSAGSGQRHIPIVHVGTVLQYVYIANRLSKTSNPCIPILVGLRGSI